MGKRERVWRVGKWAGQSMSVRVLTLPTIPGASWIVRGILALAIASMTVICSEWHWSAAVLFPVYVGLWVAFLYALLACESANQLRRRAHICRVIGLIAAAFWIASLFAVASVQSNTVMVAIRGGNIDAQIGAIAAIYQGTPMASPGAPGSTRTVSWSVHTVFRQLPGHWGEYALWLAGSLSRAPVFPDRSFIVGKGLSVPVWSARFPLWPTWFVLFCTAYLLRRRQKRVERIDGCPHCLYSLIGNVSGICPECGREIDAKPSLAVPLGVVRD